ncbi:MAG: hypothetical protein IPM37_10320 [Hahellaceae bacterium]|jgi:hypothetical protein|nr:hypothetical protein [Hahellaceae bacterium]
MRDDRALHFFLTLLTGLAITAYLSWFTYHSAQQAVERQLVGTSTAIVQSLDKELMRLNRLPEFIAHLDETQRQRSISLFPYVLSVEPAPPTPPDAAGSPKPSSRHLDPVTVDMDDQGHARAIQTLLVEQPSGALQLTLNISRFLSDATVPFTSVPVTLSVFDLRSFAQDPFFTVSLGPEQPEEQRSPQWLDELSFSTSLGAPSRDWLVRVQPRMGFNGYAHTNLPLIIFITGCLISALLAQIIKLRTGEAGINYRE